MSDPQNPQEPPATNTNEQPSYQPPQPASPTPSVPPAPAPAPVRPTPAPASTPSPVMVPAQPSGPSGQNNSEMGSSDLLPPGIDGWGWGPFLLTWIWGIFNGVWVSLLVFVPIPFLAIVISIILGINGRKWAWKNKKWDSVEQFNEVQRKWSIAGLIVGAIFLLIIPIVFILVVVVAINPTGRMNQVNNNNANSEVRSVGSAVSACIVDQTSKGTLTNIIYSDVKLDLATKKGGCANANNLIVGGYASSVSSEVKMANTSSKVCVYMITAGSPPGYASYDSSERVVATAPNGKSTCI